MYDTGAGHGLLCFQCFCLTEDKPQKVENNSPVFDETKNERLIERRNDGGDVCVMTSIL